MQFARTSTLQTQAASAGQSDGAAGWPKLRPEKEFGSPPETFSPTAQLPLIQAARQSTASTPAVSLAGDSLFSLQRIIPLSVNHLIPRFPYSLPH
jgi:hypothetical protein